MAAIGLTASAMMSGNALINSSLIYCDSPAHSAGSVHVRVTNSNGQGTLNLGFTYHNPPNIVSVNPNSGDVSGGTAVTITGTDFTTVGSTSVTFGGTSASGVAVVNSTTITCTSPAHAQGAVTVSVSNDFGSDNLPTLHAAHTIDSYLICGVDHSRGFFDF